MKRDGVIVGAAEFKAKCLGLLKAVETHRLGRVIVTRRGKPVAELRAAKTAPFDLWGAMRGCVSAAPGVDLAAPALDEPLDAEAGVIHR
jgi:prevent-host-death family protein